MATTMLESILKRGMAKGMAEGQIKSVITVLETRFGEIPASLQKKVLNVQDTGRIETLLKLATTCQTLKEFQKALQLLSTPLDCVP